MGHGTEHPSGECFVYGFCKRQILLKFNIIFAKNKYP